MPPSRRGKGGGGGGGSGGELASSPLGRVLLVGNGPSIRGSGLGRAIDSFDTVVRFNSFVTKGIEEDTGSKTSIWCHMMQVQLRARARARARVRVTPFVLRPTPTPTPTPNTLTSGTTWAAWSWCRPSHSAARRTARPRAQEAPRARPASRARALRRRGRRGRAGAAASRCPCLRGRRATRGTTWSSRRCAPHAPRSDLTAYSTHTSAYLPAYLP